MNAVYPHKSIVCLVWAARFSYFKFGFCFYILAQTYKIFQWVFKTFHPMDITVIITLGFHDVLRYMIYLSFVQCKMCLKTIFVVLKHALNPFFWTFFWAVLFMSGRFKNEVIQCLKCYLLSFIECVGRWVCAIVYGCSQPCWSRAWLKV